MPKVAISVGHHPEEETREIEFKANTKVSNLIYTMLINNGYQAILIDSEKMVDKVKRINEYKPDIAIECHFNRLNYPHDPVKFGEGYEVHVMAEDNDSKKLGGYVLEGMNAKLPFNRRGLGIVERKDLLFLKHTECPAILVEPLFLDNKFESSFLLMDKGYEFISLSYLIGINKYFKSQ